MPRKGPVPKREVLPDPLYNSRLVTKFVNRLMYDGKKGAAEKIFYSSLENLAEKTGEDPMRAFEKALENAAGRCVLNGNIDPVADVLACDAEHTYQAIMACAARTAGHRALFMPGCELPTATPLENVRAIDRALRDLGAR